MRIFLTILFSVLLASCGGGGGGGGGSTAAPAPTPITSVTQATGIWKVNYSGSDSGTCTLTAFSTGSIQGNCLSAVSNASSTVVGTVSNNGAITFSVSTGSMSLSGTIYVGVGNGTWGFSPSVSNGTWSATRTSLGSLYIGTWVINVAGAYTGQCPTIQINLAGTVTGVCDLMQGTVGATLGTSGSVSDSGAVNIVAGIAPYFIFSGTMVTNTSGAGTWTYGAYTGTWTSDKQ